MHDRVREFHEEFVVEPIRDILARMCRSLQNRCVKTSEVTLQSQSRQSALAMRLRLGEDVLLLPSVGLLLRSYR